MPNLFEVTDPRGRTVICTTQNWQRHVLRKHQIMQHRQKEVADVIQSPTWICSDVDFPERENYYRLKPTSLQYIKVVIEFRDANLPGELVTAYETDSGKSGEQILWLASQR